MRKASPCAVTPKASNSRRSAKSITTRFSRPKTFVISAFFCSAYPAARAMTVCSSYQVAYEYRPSVPVRPRVGGCGPYAPSETTAPDAGGEAGEGEQKDKVCRAQSRASLFDHAVFFEMHAPSRHIIGEREICIFCETRASEINIAGSRRRSVALHRAVGRGAQQTLGDPGDPSVQLLQVR